MESIWSDVRFALRVLRKQPVFAATVIATFALAIGGTTAVFSVVQAAMLQPLPFREPDRIVVLSGVAGPEKAVRGASTPEVADWIQLNRSMEAMSPYSTASLTMATSDAVEQVPAEMVSSAYFGIIGARAVMGRVLASTEDGALDASPVVVISHALWQRKFGGDSAIVGKSVSLNDRSMTIVGVVHPDFRGLGFATDIWFPASMLTLINPPQVATNRGRRWLNAIARVKTGTSVEAAQRDMDRVAAQLAELLPESNRDRYAQVQSLRESYLGNTQTLFLALLTAVGLFLLIACANVVGLQLVRAAARTREIAVRLAIGATRTRLVQQLVVEGVVLALCGGAAGLLMAYWGVEILRGLTPAGVFPPYAQPSINAVVLLFAVGVSCTAGVVFGLAPSMQSRRLSLTSSLKTGTRTAGAGIGGFGRIGAKQMLVVTEVALAFTLLTGAGLLIRTLRNQLAVDPGFNADGLVSTTIGLPAGLAVPQQRLLVEQLRDALRAVPGVEGVAIGSDVPLMGGTGAFIYIPDRAESYRYYRHHVMPDYFRTLGITVVAGRAIDESDREGAPAVAMVNEAMARRFWPGGSAIGKRLQLNDANGAEVTIVGVVGNARYRNLTADLGATEPDIFYPLAQGRVAAIRVALRSGRSTGDLAAVVQSEVRRLAPTTAIGPMRSVRDLLDQLTASGRFGSSVLGGFSALALVLAAIGLYGVLSFLVRMGEREIAIRMALGARTNRVVGRVVGQGLFLSVIGLAIGIAASASASRALTTQLFGVTPRDPATFATAAIVLLIVAVSASFIPARRAAMVDPQLTLRSE